MLSEGHGVVHYGSIDYTYEGKQQKFIDWSEKRIDDKNSKVLTASSAK
jgi:hypothetical protein